MRRIPAALLAIAVMVLSSCSGAGDDDATASVSGTESSTTTVVPDDLADADTVDAAVSPPVAPVDPQKVATRSIAPSEVAVGASDAFGDHVIYLPETPLDDRLLVYLPGTGGRPRPGMPFLETASGQGITTIGFAYQNKGSVFSTCAGDTDPGCTGNLRTERLSGEDVSPLEEVFADDAVVPRLTALLRYLDEQQPDGPWSGFLDGEEQPEWPAISFAGHSQGSGMAAMLSKGFPVERAIVLAGISDMDPTSVEGATPDAVPIASWIEEPGVTSGDRIFTFAHRGDGAVPKMAGWQALGIEGEPALWSEVSESEVEDIDGNMFVSDRPLGPGERAHGDPLNGPYEQLWLHLLTG